MLNRCHLSGWSYASLPKISFNETRYFVHLVGFSVAEAVCMKIIELWIAFDSEPMQIGLFAVPSEWSVTLW